MPPKTKKTVAEIESSKKDEGKTEKKSNVSKYDPLSDKNDNSQRANESNKYAKESMMQKKKKDKK